MLHKVSIAGLTMDPASNTPIIILKSEKNNQAIPIWIGLLEATSIASALQKIKYERPMTHDLFKNFTELLDISISRIEVCDLKDNTFYAKIYFISKDGNFEMDARPSDAIMQKSKMGDGEAEVLDTSEEGKKWADYLESLSPEDFGKFKI
jgi:bifunctional DNase/RNase